MITPNIEALSMTELQYIARKQGIEDSDSMDREDLVEVLEDLYEDSDNRLSADESQYASSNQQRFMNSLVEHGSEEWIGDLPGVVKLPEAYAETTIHLMLKDPYWAHAYWSVCSTELARLEHSVDSYEFFIRVYMHESIDGAGDSDSYDIYVQKTDSNWNVNLPVPGRAYSVSLHYVCESGKEGMLCESRTVTSPSCYWLDHVSELNRDQACFNLLFSSLVTKGGALLDNPLVQQIVVGLEEERRN